jgi:hypothetical protein
LLGEDSLLYFADVCAGPGGFSEYVLWRKRWRSKGFGFTLKGKSDFKLEDFYAGTRKCEVNRARTVIIVFSEFNLKLSVVGCPICYFETNITNIIILVQNTSQTMVSERTKKIYVIGKLF